MNEKFPCLSKEELISFLSWVPQSKVEYLFTGLAIVSGLNDSYAEIIQKKSATIKESGRLIGIFNLLGEQYHTGFCPNHKPFIRLKRIQGFSKNLNEKDIISMSIKFIESNCNLSNTGHKIEVRAYITEGIVLLGIPISEEGKGDLISKNPHKMPFYKPGALNPWFARLIVNLAAPRAKKGILHDPFCGTGTIPLTFEREWGMEAICSDIRKDMCYGSLKNLNTEAKNLHEVIRADARFPPIRNGAVSLVVTDPPYGRSIRSHYSDSLGLTQTSMKSVLDELVDSGIVVLSIDRNIAEKLNLGESYNIIVSCPMYVHNRLSRTILVLEKK